LKFGLKDGMVYLALCMDMYGWIESEDEFGKGKA
jgi:hypothetical protein